MDKTIIQVPVSKTLKNQATLAATNLGFSSLQESIRIFLTQLSRRQINLSFTPTSPLSPKNEKKYIKMIRDIKSGKTKTKSFDNTNDLFKYLNS